MPPLFNVPTKELSDDPLVLLQSASDAIKSMGKTDFKNQMEDRVIAPLKKAARILGGSENKDERSLAAQILYRLKVLQAQIKTASETKEQNSILYKIRYRLKHWKVALEGINPQNLGQTESQMSEFFVSTHMLYKNIEELIKKYKEQLDEIAVEGLVKGWVFPKLED